MASALYAGLAYHVFAAAWPFVQDAPAADVIVAQSQNAVNLATSAEGTFATGRHVVDSEHPLLATAMVISGVNALSAAMKQPVEFAGTGTDAAAFANYFLANKRSRDVSSLGQVCVWLCVRVRVRLCVRVRVSCAFVRTALCRRGTAA